MTTQTITLTSEFSKPTLASGYEVVDITHLPQRPKSQGDYEYFIVRAKRHDEEKPPRRPGRKGTRLTDLIAEFSATPDGEGALAEGRQWVGETLYADEPDSLQALRLRQGLSQANLAARIETTQARVSIYERGLEKPEFEMMMRLCDVLGVDMNRLAAAIEYASKRKELKNG